MLFLLVLQLLLVLLFLLCCLRLLFVFLLSPLHFFLLLSFCMLRQSMELLFRIRPLLGLWLLWDFLLFFRLFFPSFFHSPSGNSPDTTASSSATAWLGRGAAFLPRHVFAMCLSAPYVKHEHYCLPAHYNVGDLPESSVAWRTKSPVAIPALLIIV